MKFKSSITPETVSHDKAGAIRSTTMSKIKSKGTKPEMAIRKILHHRGYRYRANYNKLPGRPDIVLPKYRALILVNGCYWHAHSCNLFKIPKTNRTFWLKKFTENVARDEENIVDLISLGWRVAVIWECALRKNSAYPNAEKVVRSIENWLQSEERELEITEKTLSNTISLSDSKMNSPRGGIN